METNSFTTIMSGIQKATDQVIQETVKQADALIHNLMQSTEMKLNDFITDFKTKKGFVLEVKINDREPQKLTAHAAPFLERMIVNAKLGLNTLLVGPAGCGKTFAASQLAEVMELTFGHLNLTAGASETWLFGRQTPSGFVNGIFAELYENGGVFLADEIDAADPNLLLSINTAISSDSFYNPMNGRMLKRNKDFVFLGAANTYGKGGTSTYNGRSRLDFATLDRFVIIDVNYDEAIEEILCPNKKMRGIFWEVRKELTSIKAEEVLSSRCLRNAYLQHEAGTPFKTILESITASWPKDLKKTFVKHAKDFK